MKSTRANERVKCVKDEEDGDDDEDGGTGMCYHIKR